MPATCLHASRHYNSAEAVMVVPVPHVLRADLLRWGRRFIDPVGADLPICRQADALFRQLAVRSNSRIGASWRGGGRR